MNDKYMTLFKKTDEQIQKELYRRGIKKKISKSVSYPSNGQFPCYSLISRDRAIAEIIYKDAFDAGRSLKAKEVAEEKTYDYLIEDDVNCCYKVSLTESQIRFLNWLDDHEMLGRTNYEEFRGENYKIVGRI